MYAFESSFFSYIPRSGTARSYGTSIFKELFSIVAAPIYIPTNLIGEFPSLHTLSSIYCLQIFWWWPSGPYEVIPHCSFDSHFSDIWWASLVSQVVKNLLAVQETWVWSLGWKISWRREWLPTLAFFAWRIPWTKEPCCCCSVIKSCSTLCDPKDCSIPGLPYPSRSPGVCSNSCPLSQWCHPTISSCCPFLLLPSVLLSIWVFSNELALPIRWPKYWRFSFSISPSNECSGLISLRIDWFDLPAVQGTLKSLLKHHSLKAPILQCSVFLMVQCPSIHDYWENHSFDYTELCQQSDVSAF